MKMLAVVLMALVALTSAGMAASLEESIGITYLANRWTFNGTLNCDIQGAAGAAQIVNNGSTIYYSMDSDSITLFNGAGQNANGTGAYLKLPDHIIQNNQKDRGFTFEMFVNTNKNWQNAGYFRFGNDIVDGEWNGSRHMSMSSYYTDDKCAVVRFSGGNQYQEFLSSLGGFANMGVKSHVAVVFDNFNSSAAIYMDGELKGFEPLQLTRTEAGDDPWNDTLNFIGRGKDARERLLSGDILDFRVWTYAMTPADIHESIALGSEVATTVPEPATLIIPGLVSLAMLRLKK